MVSTVKSKLQVINPCKHGGDEEVEVRHGTFGYSVWCVECRASTLMFETKAEAIEAWNEDNKVEVING